MSDPGDPVTLAEEAAKTLAANAAGTDEDARFPVAGVQALRDNGLFGLLVPTRYGGKGGGLGDLAAVAQVLAAACPSTAMIWAMHCQQVDVLVRHAAPRLAEAVLPRVADGRLYLGSVTTEPGGSRGTLLSASSPVREDGDRLLIDREAPIVTGGLHADGYLVTMRAAGAGDRNVSLLYAERSQLEVEPNGAWDAMGMRGTESIACSLHGAIPSWQVVGEPGGFRTIAVESMAPAGHIAWAACWLGTARGAVADFVALLRSADRPRGVDPASDLVRERLARIRIDLELVSAYLRGAIAEVDERRGRGESLDTPPVQIHLDTLKVAAAESTYRAVDRLVQLAGLSLGYRRDSALGLERRLRDLRSASLNYPNDRLLTAIGALSVLDRGVRLL